MIHIKIIVIVYTKLCLNPKNTIAKYMNGNGSSVLHFYKVLNISKFCTSKYCFSYSVFKTNTEQTTITKILKICDLSNF